jgi:hypothetical protein
MYINFIPWKESVLSMKLSKTKVNCQTKGTTGHQVLRQVNLFHAFCIYLHDYLGSLWIDAIDI